MCNPTISGVWIDHILAGKRPNFDSGRNLRRIERQLNMNVADGERVLELEIERAEKRLRNSVYATGPDEFLNRVAKGAPVALGTRIGLRPKLERV